MRPISGFYLAIIQIEVFDKIGALATRDHRSITNYIEYVLLKHLEDVEREQGPIEIDNTPRGV